MPLFPKTTEPFDVTLDCDDGDPKAVFTIRPLTYIEVAEAKAAAGKMPWKGTSVSNQVHIDGLKARLEAMMHLRPDLQHLPAPQVLEQMTDSERDMFEAQVAAAVAAIYARLSDEDLQAVDAAESWYLAHQGEIVRRGVLKVNGEAVDVLAAIESIQPASLARRVLAELAEKVKEAGSLSHEGKAE